MLFDRSLEQHPELVTEERPSPFSDEYIKKLDKRFGVRGGPWHGKSLYELVRRVEDAVDGRYEGVFWQFFRVVNQHNNYTLHHSAIGVADPITWDDPEDTPNVRVGPSPEWRDSALWAAPWSYGLLAVATLRRLSPERAEEFSDFLDDVLRSFVFFTREQVKNVSRNDLCPCASGKKFKHCHGPWVE
ncbi:MAG: motif [Thermoleophilaceae bacterium]|nr:motif [Thermoleophilaceae bacterium]